MANQTKEVQSEIFTKELLLQGVRFEHKKDTYQYHSEFQSIYNFFEYSNQEYKKKACDIFRFIEGGFEWCACIMDTMVYGIVFFNDCVIKK